MWMCSSESLIWLTLYYLFGGQRDAGMVEIWISATSGLAKHTVVKRCFRWEMRPNKCETADEFSPYLPTAWQENLYNTLEKGKTIISQVTISHLRITSVLKYTLVHSLITYCRAQIMLLDSHSGSRHRDEMTSFNFAKILLELKKASLCPLHLLSHCLKLRHRGIPMLRKVFWSWGWLTISRTQLKMHIRNQEGNWVIGFCLFSLLWMLSFQRYVGCGSVGKNRNS